MDRASGFPGYPPISSVALCRGLFGANRVAYLHLWITAGCVRRCGRLLPHGTQSTRGMDASRAVRPSRHTDFSLTGLQGPPASWLYRRVAHRDSVVQPIAGLHASSTSNLPAYMRLSPAISQHDANLVAATAVQDKRGRGGAGVAGPLGAGHGRATRS